MAETGPIKEVVHDRLVFGNELVQFIHEHYARNAPGAGIVEFTFEEVESVSGTYAFVTEGFPKERVGLMWIGHFHTVYLYEDEVVEFFGEDGGVELGDYFADCNGFAGAWRAGDVDAGAGARGDSGFEVGVDGCELGGSAGQQGGNRGDMEVGARERVRGCCMGGREDACTEWGNG